MSRIYSSSRLALELNPACAIPRDFYHGLLAFTLCVARVRFHHMATPLQTCITAIRQASDITALLGIPKMSPVWMARLTITMRVPAGAVREPSA